MGQIDDFYRDAALADPVGRGPAVMSVQDHVAIRTDTLDGQRFIIFTVFETASISNGLWGEELLLIFADDGIVGADFRKTELIIRIGMQLFASHLSNECAPEKAGFDRNIDGFIAGQLL